MARDQLRFAEAGSNGWSTERFLFLFQTGLLLQELSLQSQPSRTIETFEMPKGTVPGRRGEELSADCQRDFLGVCARQARQVSNPGLQHIISKIYLWFVVPCSITLGSLCVFALAKILSKQLIQTS